MIDTALATGQPVKISPKFWAEHLGLPYHQADIREQERPREGRQATGLMRFSHGSRIFTRYGYGDLLREGPQVERPCTASGPARSACCSGAIRSSPPPTHARSRFCGSAGVEIMEPLSFKGRRGSGHAGPVAPGPERTGTRAPTSMRR